MQLKKFTWLGPTNEIGKGTDLEDRTAIGGGRDTVNDNVVADPKGVDPITQDGRHHRVLSRKRITKNTVHTRLTGRSSGTTAEINLPLHPLHQNAKEHEVLHLGCIPATLLKNLLATRIVGRVTTLSEVFHINGAEDVSQVAVGRVEGHHDEGETAGRTRLVDEVLPAQDTRSLPLVVRNLTTTLVVGCTALALKTILNATRGIDLYLAIQQSRSPSPPGPIPSFDVETTGALVDGDAPHSRRLVHRASFIKAKANFIRLRTIFPQVLVEAIQAIAETIRTKEAAVDSLLQAPKITAMHLPRVAGTSQTPPPPTASENETSIGPVQSNIAFRLGGQDRPVGEEKPESEVDDAQKMLPTNIGQSDTSTNPNKGGKISFAFKAKTTPAPAPKPVPDLAQRMLAREPPARVAEPPRNRMASGPPPKFKPEPRFDRRERDRERERDRHRERDRDRGRNDRRDFRDPRGFRDPRDRRDGRKDDHRFDHRHDRRRGDRRQDFRPERRRDRSPEPKKQPKILTRPKPRPILPEEFAKSDSVYYRKPGNESVIGAGTYGKVFKAIHVYTQRKVALKKIRMEGEKDGFPVTAVREIKLLQHLRNDNVVSLLEVMVERNECFMVFEYLSHDLTGLINHPTFTLTAAHKKDLAKQMFEGLSYLHHRGVLHRDIKAANILISNRGQLKYADFGLARFFSKSRQLDYTNRVITIWYRPPELLLGETRYGPAVDVWSAACVYVEMFTKKAVFPGEGGEISQMEKLYNCLGTPTRAEWPDIVEMPWFELMRPTERKRRVFEEVYGRILTPAALDLVSQIFRYDPTARPTAEEILAHPYFASEEPRPQQAIELENIEGDWHEFESKALRKEKDREARRAEYQRDKEKRKAGTSAPPSERETKRAKQDAEDSQSSAQPTEQ
ncbi:hypothetical protein APSETT444_002228 [Aspergillus pseudonomiae]